MMMPPSSVDVNSYDGNDTTVTNETELTEIETPRVQGEDVGESLPTPEEIRATVNPQPAHKRGPLQGGRSLIIFAVALVLLICVSVGLGVGLSNRDNEGGRKSTPESIQTYVVDRGLSKSSDFELDWTPQHKAARWMAEQDPLNMATPNDFVALQDDDAYPFVLRYTMAVLYYATNGDQWRYQFNFLSHRETCSWNGVLLSTAGGFIPFGLICNRDKRAFSMYLDNMQLNGYLPDELRVLTTMKFMDFNFNDELGDELPSGICEMVDLEKLSVAYSTLRGTIPSCINNLKELDLFLLSNNYLSGTLPDMSSMTKLRRIGLDDNNLMGDITNAFDTHSELRFLYLEDNNFTGTVSSTFLAQNKELMVVDISDNYLEGEVAAELFSHPRLQVLDLNGNNIGGTLPEFPPHDFLFLLALHDNDLHGNITQSITNLVELRHLDLSNNVLNGPIIDELGTMKNLTYLYLADNTFEPGPIPDSFAALTDMEEFSLKHTRRTGFLPTFISDWKNLKLLDIENNSIKGQIPETYGDLASLEFLLLKDNELDGDVPTSFSNLASLRAAFFENNLFSGNLDHMCAMPNFKESAGDIDGNEYLVADCDGSGQVTCNCCVCCDPDDAGDIDKKCDDKTLISNLDPIHESAYNRVEFSFDDDIRYYDRSFLP